MIKCFPLLDLARVFLPTGRSLMNFLWSVITVNSPLKLIPWLFCNTLWKTPLLHLIWHRFQTLFGQSWRLSVAKGLNHRQIVKKKNLNPFLLFRLQNNRFFFSKSLNKLASHADVLRDSSRFPAPQTPADLSGKRRRPITADFQIWEVHFGPWEISRLTI